MTLGMLMIMLYKRKVKDREVVKFLKEFVKNGISSTDIDEFIYKKETERAPAARFLHVRDKREES